MRVRYATGIACVVIATGRICEGQVPVMKPPVTSSSERRLETKKRADALGITLTDALAEVFLPEEAIPSENDIHKAAASSRNALDDLMNRKRTRQTFLGLSTNIGDLIVQIGQWAGGGGAIVFGLAASNGSTEGAQNNGRNAAYAGVVATGVTLLKSALHLDAKKAASVACAYLDGRKFALVQKTNSWEGQASSVDFRTGFYVEGGPYAKFNAEVGKLSEDCFENTVR